MKPEILKSLAEHYKRWADDDLPVRVIGLMALRRQIALDLLNPEFAREAAQAVAGGLLEDIGQELSIVLAEIEKRIALRDNAHLN